MSNDPHLKFHYVKTTAARTLHVDGAIGGVLPTGDISLALWVQRLPVPSLVVHALEGDKLGVEIDRQGKDGLIREVEVNLLLRAEVAQAVGEFLINQAVIARKIEERKTVSSD